MYKVTKYPHGTFSWADAMSTDAGQGKKFFADLMGWEIEDIPMGNDMFYTMFKQDGESVAGLGQMPPEMQAQGIPSHWQSYVTVDDVDAMVGKVTELGGTVVMEPFDVFDSGRMMVLQDPTGAHLSLWQAKSHIGAGLINTPGAMAWNELATRDPQKAQDFFGQLFGWEFQKDGSQDYTFFLNSGRMNGGIIQMTDEWGDVPPNWNVYFSVANIDEAAEKVKSLGGNLIMPIVDAGEVGRFAVISDPQGGVCTLIQLSQPEDWNG